jgi:hypothetical protein
MKQSDLTKKDVDTFHKKLDKLVHKTFGHSSKEKKDMKTEDLALMAQKAEMDHEVQMARSDLYKAAKYSIKLHDMLKSVSEQQGLEGWVAAKITKASDYLSSVYHYMEYELMSQNESVTYLDEGVLDTLKAAGRDITQYAKSLVDPATAAKVQADNQNKVQMQTLFNDVNTVVALNQADVSQGYPVQPQHPEAFQRMDAQGDMKKMFPPKGKVDANTLKANLTKVAQELSKVDLSPEPQAVAASVDYKESLANKLQSKLQESTKTCKDCGKPTWETLDEAEKQKGVDGKVCWKGYKRMGTKMKGGKRVDNCVPIKKK